MIHIADLWDMDRATGSSQITMSGWIDTSSGPFVSGMPPDFGIVITEDAGPVRQGYVDRMFIPVWTGSPAEASFNREAIDGALRPVGVENGIVYQYAGPVGERGSLSAVEEGFVTERGSVFTGIDRSTVTFWVAGDIVHTMFYLQYR